MTGAGAQCRALPLAVPCAQCAVRGRGRGADPTGAYPAASLLAPSISLSTLRDKRNIACKVVAFCDRLCRRVQWASWFRLILSNVRSSRSEA